MKARRKTKANGRRLPRLEGMISEAQLRGIIEREAELLDLDFEEAVKRAKKGTLPRTPIGDDLSLLVQLLPA
ncbi:MAG TPA: hypothetical protein VNO43_11165 [Candidatus Eisenbacteria bacterium]|nr:hypothetical protein [Candidatus Eisenbacteria bacterium]